MNTLISNKQADFDGAVDHLKSELSSIRTGRANPALVEGVKVDAYGTAQELKSVASISVPDHRTLRIEPWDAGLVAVIEKALHESDIGISPTVDGKIIRLSIPQMTEDMRKDMVKVIGKKVEEARIVVRNIREDVRKEIEKMEKGKEITEDDKYVLQEDLDKVVADVNKVIDTLGKDKETQIATV
jgi:ribosome recycling factor